MSDPEKHKTESPAEQNNKPEVRYVPVEYLPEMHSEEDEIDLIELAKKIWDGRWTIIKVTALFIVLGLFVALFSPVEYQSEAILMPEIQQQQQGRAGQLLQQFGGAFGLGGVDLSNASPGMIPPQIYPRIVNSLSFQMELMEQPIRFAEYGVTTTIPDFYENHYSPSLTQWIGKLTVGLPGTLIGLLKGEEDSAAVEAADPFRAEFIQISTEELKLIEQMRERISVNLDEETGLLNASVTLHDPRAAAELNRNVIELLKEYVTEYRVEKARQDLEFVQQQHAEAKERFETAQVALAEFRDRNVSLSTARAQTELERLQDEKDLALNVYNSLSQQLEQAKLTLQEQTPVFKIVQAVNVPSEKSSPKRAMMMVVFTLLGGIAAVGWIFVWPLIENFRNG